MTPIPTRLALAISLMGIGIATPARAYASVEPAPAPGCPPLSGLSTHNAQPYGGVRFGADCYGFDHLHTPAVAYLDQPPALPWYAVTPVKRVEHSKPGAVGKMKPRSARKAVTRGAAAPVAKRKERSVAPPASATELVTRAQAQAALQDTPPRYASDIVLLGSMLPEALVTAANEATETAVAEQHRDRIMTALTDVLAAEALLYSGEPQRIAEAPAEPPAKAKRAHKRAKPDAPAATPPLGTQAVAGPDVAAAQVTPFAPDVTVAPVVPPAAAQPLPDIEPAAVVAESVVVAEPVVVTEPVAVVAAPVAVLAEPVAVLAEPVPTVALTSQPLIPPAPAKVLPNDERVMQALLAVLLDEERDDAIGPRPAHVSRHEAAPPQALARVLETSPEAPLEPAAQVAVRPAPEQRPAAPAADNIVVATHSQQVLMSLSTLMSEDEPHLGAQLDKRVAATQADKVLMTLEALRASERAAYDPWEAPPPRQRANMGDGWTTVAAHQLDEVRGGFVTGNGLRISFGIERAVYINGALAATTSLNVSDLAQLSGGRAGDGAAVDASTVGLIQTGGNNTFKAGEISASGLQTVIQNSLDNQKIQTTTVINATANSLQILRSQDLHQSIRGAITDSLRR